MNHAARYLFLKPSRRVIGMLPVGEGVFYTIEEDLATRQRFITYNGECLEVAA